MAVTKSSLVSVLVVLAITYNQGAARPSDLSNNELSSSEVETRIYKFPTAIKEGLAIVINGTIDPNDTTFIVELPSMSGKESCKISFNYITEKLIKISPPAYDEYASTEYNLTVTPGSKEGPSFSLMLAARVDRNDNDIMSMFFLHKDIGLSSQLICKIENFNDINQIVIKQGVARVQSITFEFKGNDSDIRFHN